MQQIKRRPAGPVRVGIGVATASLAFLGASVSPAAADETPIGSVSEAELVSAPTEKQSPSDPVGVSGDTTTETMIEAPPEPRAAVRETLPLTESGEAAAEDLAQAPDPKLADTRVRDLVAQTTLPESARTFSTKSAGPADALVLFDTTGPYADLGEYYALGAGLLASHSGTVTTLPVKDYTPGLAGDYTAVIYTGSTYDEKLPSAFVDDVLTGSTPVLWSGFNIWQLAANAHDRATFAERYGWDAATSFIDSTDAVSTVTYNGRSLTRNSLNTGGIVAPHVTEPEAVDVLGTAECTDAAGASTACAPIAQTTGTAFPWALKSANLTYIGEIPLSYLSETDRYLAFADIVVDILQPNATPVRQAAVRIEDVSPATEVSELEPLVDYLVGARVPFQIATVPEYHDPHGASNGGVPEFLSFQDNPELVDLLRFASRNGGMLVQHGTTHQFDDLPNPYDGTSTDDFEFIRSWCTAINSPAAPIVPCTNDSFVQIGGDLPGVDESWVVDVLNEGRNEFEKAELPVPSIFETPHYAATRRAYEAMTEVYPTRYERELLFKGLLTGAPAGAFDYYGQFFPYSVNDPYGTHVLPENLGNVELEWLNQHPPRLPADIVANARANLVGTHATASFFFHPYLDVSLLREIVEGVRAEGYAFVPADELV